MESVSYVGLTVVGLVSGFLAGFLGIGGGIIVVPALVFAAGLPVKLAAGISLVEAFFATLSGLLCHRRNRTVNTRLGLALGSGGILGAMIGSVGSAYLSGRLIMGLFILPVSAALLLIFLAPKDDLSSSGQEPSLWVAAPLGFGVGVISGLLGVGGGFLMVPLMIAVLRVQTKTAVGTSLLVILMTTLVGATGKIATGQFDFAMGICVVAFGIAGAQVGGRVNAHAPGKVIRGTLTLVLVAILVRTLIDLVSG